MKSGTCGDYSNLIVSVLFAMGYEAGYAYVHKDCYGDEQDHICAAVKEQEKWILIDATLPYRKWHGFDCLHKEYDLLLPDEFEAKMKKEEEYWTNIAKKHDNELAAGLLYAPWLHEEIVQEDENVLDSVFFLLIMDEHLKPNLYAYYQHYAKDGGSLPCMISITDGRQEYQFSIHKPKSLWDNEQWSEGYLEEEIPDRFKTRELNKLHECVSKIEPKIDKILEVLRNK